MSFTDFGWSNFRGKVPRRVRRPRQLHPDRSRASSRSRTSSSCGSSSSTCSGRSRNVVIHVILGVADRPRPERQRACGSRGSTGRCSSSRSSSRRSSWRRSGGTCTTRTTGRSTVLQAVGGLFGIPPDAFQLDWLAPGRRSDLASSPAAGVSSRCSTANTWLGWPLNSVVATGALQSIPRELYEAAEMDGANALAEVPERDPAVPAAGDAAVRDLRLRHHVQPLLPVVLHVGRRAVRPDRDPRHPGLRLVNDASCSASRRVLRLLFFLLLAITLVTNRLAQSDGELCRVSAASRADR